MQKQVTTILLTLCSLSTLTVLSGCGLKYVEVKHPEKFNSKRLLDPNHSPFEISKSDTEPNKTTIHLHPAEIMLEKPCRVNYRKMEYWFGKIVAVDGKLQGGKEYPIWIDSGFKGAEIALNDIVVRENNLAILYSIGKKSELRNLPARERTRGGLCFLPSLEIGELTIRNPICAYLPWHQEFQVFGLPLWQGKHLLLGISVMSRFRYIRFDNRKMQLEFSYNQTFHPEEPAKWAHYPFVLQEKDGGDNRIMVDIPIAGDTYSIYFDTGGAGTVVMPDMWGKIRNRITAMKPKQGKFLSYQHGFVPCHKVIAKTLNVGNIVIKNAEIVIMPEDTPYLPKDVPGYISIWTFKDTSIVLDFEHNLMWVKSKQLNGFPPLRLRSG